MADFNGVRMTDVKANPPVMIDSSFNGRSRVFVEKFAGVVGTHVANSRIIVARLPKGAVPLKFEFIASVANTATLDWGDGTTADKFVDGMDPDNAEQVYVGANQVDGAIGEKLAAETDIFVTILGAALATGNYVFYSHYMLVD